MHSTNLRQILPAAKGSRDANPNPFRPPKRPKKRQVVSLACEPCRKRKSRCDGKQPICNPCHKRQVLCVYAPEETAALRVANLKSRNESLQNENSRLWGFFQLLGSMPRDEVDTIMSDLRAAAQPDAFLRLTRDSSPSIRDSQSPDVAPAGTPRDNARLLAMDLRALANSKLRVSARPWTTVAGDGVVSDLISSFFTWDDAFFFPFIDRDAFIEDMRSLDVQNATYCSPFLVNAICASRYFTSRTAKVYERLAGEDLGLQFLNEAKKLLSLEGDQASLTTVQGLAIMFTVSAYRGSDRNGSVYRFAAYERLRRLDLAKIFDDASSPSSAADTRQRRAFSKAVWGLFCFESIVGYVYLQQSLIPPPSIPRCFESVGSRTANEDLYGNPYTDESAPPPFVPGVLDATCDLSCIMYRVMQWNSDSPNPGDEKDKARRQEFRAQLDAWRTSLPSHMTEAATFTPQTCFLRIYCDEVLISIVRPLHHATRFGENNNTTVGDVLIQCAERDTILSRRWIQEYTLQEYSCMNLCGLYNSALVLIDFLGDSRVHATFVEVCMLLRRTAADFPMASFILQGIMALAWSLNTTIPARAVPYLQESHIDKKALRDLPLAFALPQAASIRELLGDEGEAASQTLAEMGTLLAKWSELSIE